MGMRILLAGQDISAYVNESTIDIKDALGQGAGTGAVVAGRADTASFVTRLGPLYTAVGAGTVVYSPTLVRMGEVLIYNANNQLVFGGYASKFDELPDAKTAQSLLVKLDCYDYWQHLDRIYVNEVYDGLTDIQMVSALCNKYAPWINLSYLPTVPAYLFGPRHLRNMSLQKALQGIADVTGRQIWITPDKKFKYLMPNQGLPAPFALSETPNYTTSFPFEVLKHEFDDTSAICRVYFYGGKVPSDDYTQDISMFANGSNTTFPLAYYPRNAKDGKIHVTINNGPDLVIGSATGPTDAPGYKNDTKNQLKPTGIADVLTNYDAHTLIFAYAPAAGSIVKVKYRYEYPLVVTITDTTAYQFWGQYLDGAISDNTVFDRQQATQRCRVLLTEMSKGLRTLQVRTWKEGIWVGQVVRVDSNVRNIHDNFVVQQVQVKPEPGAGVYRYEITLGAWNWNLIDVMKQAAAFATPSDNSTTESGLTVTALECYDNLKVTSSIAIPATDQLGGPATHPYGAFYARATFVGDGHDAFAGFASISS